MLHIVNEFLKSDNQVLREVVSSMLSVTLVSSQQKSCSREESKMRGFEFVEHAMFGESSPLRASWEPTYTELGLFATDGVYHNHLRNVLRAYSCFRPSIGYVQVREEEGQKLNESARDRRRMAGDGIHRQHLLGVHGTL
eukprot:759741-Hanusia_phi.AAC.4